MHWPVLFQISIVTTNIYVLAQECPRISSPHGEPGKEVKTEIECALQCKVKFNCFGYLYKNHKEFLLGPNSYQSNCVLQTIWDKNFLAEEVLIQTEYKVSKVGTVIRKKNHRGWSSIIRTDVFSSGA